MWNEIQAKTQQTKQNATTVPPGSDLFVFLFSFSAMHMNAMQCNEMQCNAIQCNAMQCNTI